jgi:hypothetical protein
MLIDSYLPRFDVSERHRTRVAASPETTYAALWTADLAKAPVVRMLVALRALPGALRSGVSGLRALLQRGSRPVTLATFQERGFRLLAELPPTELVIGLEGRFWRPTGNLSTPSAGTFRSNAAAPGTARGVWNFHLQSHDDGGTELTTETRVLCADAGARRRFLPYWYLIRPASGVIRRVMLREIRRSAEAAEARGLRGERVGHARVAPRHADADDLSRRAADVGRRRDGDSVMPEG